MKFIWLWKHIDTQYQRFANLNFAFWYSDLFFKVNFNVKKLHTDWSHGHLWHFNPIILKFVSIFQNLIHLGILSSFFVPSSLLNCDQCDIYTQIYCWILTKQNEKTSFYFHTHFLSNWIKIHLSLVITSELVDSLRICN